MSTVSEVLNWWEPFHDQFSMDGFVDIYAEDKAFADLIGVDFLDDDFGTYFSTLCVEMLKGESGFQIDVFDRLCDTFRKNVSFTGPFPWESQEILT